MGEPRVPFSAKSRDSRMAVQDDFPATARRGLLHTIDELVELGFVDGWKNVVREVARIGRVPQGHLGFSSDNDEAERLLMDLEWQKSLDFCERLYDHLAQPSYKNEKFTALEDVRKFIGSELNRLFMEEGLAFEFRDGLVIRRGRRHTTEQVGQAQLVLGDPRLGSARDHFVKARQFFEKPTNPDLENAIKEAVCAVEAAGKSLFPEASASTLGELIRWLVKSHGDLLPKSLSKSIEGLYAYRSAGRGVGHGGATDGAPTLGVAEYVMAVAASSIIYFVDIAKQVERELPF